MFDIVVAADREWGIGKANALPWPKLTGDMAHFRRVTSDAAAGQRNAVIMGRRTWESAEMRGKPLPKRLNVVVTRHGRALTRSGSNAPTSGPNALANGTNAPAGETNAPTSGMTHSASGTTHSASETTHSASGMAHPARGTNVPGTGPSVPGTGLTVPGTGLSVPDGVLVASSLDAALAAASQPDIATIFVIGGGQLFREAFVHPELRFAYLTRVDGAFGCDAHIPDLDALGFFADDWSGTTTAEDSGVRYRIERLRRAE